jgi:flagellar motor protein MotB
MLSDTETLVGQVQEEENYFVSMTDMMVGMLFLFIILLMVFALNFRVGDDDSKRVKDCLTRLLLKNAQLSAEINKNVNAMQDSVRKQIEALELAADQRRRLLADLRRQLGLQGLPVEVDEHNGVLRLTEASIRFDPDRSDLDVRARQRVASIARVLATVVRQYAACRVDNSATCGQFRRAALDTIFIEGHTDTTGAVDPRERDRRNWQLSTERATETYRALLAEAPELREYRNRKGEEILSVSGYSSARPIVNGGGRNAYARNRRIDLRFVMDADTTINLHDLVLLNDQVKAQIARLTDISQESIEKPMPGGCCR